MFESKRFRLESEAGHGKLKDGVEEDVAIKRIYFKRRRSRGLIF